VHDFLLVGLLNGEKNVVSSGTRDAFRLDASESELTGLGKICLPFNLDLFIHRGRFAIIAEIFRRFCVSRSALIFYYAGVFTKVIEATGLVLGKVSNIDTSCSRNSLLLLRYSKMANKQTFPRFGIQDNYRGVDSRDECLHMAKPRSSTCD